jgi:cytochrome c-type biogenesis protein CcmH/NrfG
MPHRDIKVSGVVNVKRNPFANFKKVIPHFFYLRGSMGKIEKEGGSTVKKETMWLVASIALIAGFLGGIVFGVYKSESLKPFQNAMFSQSVEKGPGESAEKAAQIFEFEKETRENPSDVAAWTNLGNLYFDTGKYKKAIRAYTQSLSLNPNNADVTTDLGIMFRRTGNPRKAIELFDKAAQIDPRQETALYDKGIVLMHDLNDVPGAIKAWEELLKRNPAATSPTGQPIKNLIDTLRKSAKP